MPSSPAIDPSMDLQWKGEFTNAELNSLHAECFEHRLFDDDWWKQVNRYSLGWVCLRRAGKLIGFVNVATDGGVHAFVLDTMVTAKERGRRFGSLLIEEAVAQSKLTGCEWLHVDFDAELKRFYFDACGFDPTEAGLIRLK